MNVELFLAAAEADPMISGKWLLDAIPIVGAAVVLILGRKHIKEQGAKEERATRTTIDGQPIGVELVETLATKQEMRDLEARLVGEIKKLETSLSKERDVARSENGHMHARIDRTSDALSNMTGQLSQIDANLSRLINLQLTKGRTP